ncbi:hypothetical protein FN846DRAFT_968019 [Sphaerosporella brunnea]|uniref:Uncharacterized protein n=1 Tax=Sphaerosporella brunnea TaxID=1250544 RepID=A0A5J5EL72_9PEZI|nr:hypothetical protein FN846DRAFT_968019 [Sphaerosporella brunnea]
MLAVLRLYFFLRGRRGFEGPPAAAWSPPTSAGAGSTVSAAVGSLQLGGGAGLGFLGDEMGCSRARLGVGIWNGRGTEAGGGGQERRQSRAGADNGVGVVDGASAKGAAAAAASAGGWG